MIHTGIIITVVILAAILVPDTLCCSLITLIIACTAAVLAALIWQSTTGADLDNQQPWVRDGRVALVHCSSADCCHVVACGNCM
jgi:hypothetical protein